MNMRKLNESLLSGLALTWLLYVGPGVRADDDRDQFKARLIGYNEVPSVSTPARGEFEARISRDDGMIEYEHSNSGLIGTVQKAHIHLAQHGVNGRHGNRLSQTASSPAPQAVSGLTQYNTDSERVM